MPVFDPVVAEYRYFVADFLSNAVIAELPFKSVSYERALKGAGSFSGNIPVIDKTAAYDLYENTMPGKTALYVVRNNVCVWGGIIWSRSYSVQSRDLSVNASEFTSYFYHRNIWKTYSHDYTATVVVTSGTAAVTLDSGDFPFASGMPVRISFYETQNWGYNGDRLILSSPSPTDTTFSVSIPGMPNGTYASTNVYVRVDTYDYVRQLLNEMLVDFSSIGFANDEIEPGSQTYYTVSTKALTSNVVTLTTSTTHDILVGQVVDVVNLGAPFDGVYEVKESTTTTITYDRTAGNVSPTAVSANTKTVTNKQIASGVATLTTSASHGFTAGETVVITNVDAADAGLTVFNGTFTIATTPSATTFTYLLTGAVDVASTAVSGSAVVTPAILSGTYGPFPGNSDFGLTYSTNAYSGVYVNSLDKIRRGYELRSIGEELDEYSDIIDGFEYRIDCSYDSTTSSFERVFTLIPIDFPNPPPAGEASPITRFGAQDLVFEYPGNIMDVKLDESAEDAATRFFVVGNIGDLGEDASEPYAAASAVDLLEQGWPILDSEHSIKESSNKYKSGSQFVDPGDEDVLYDYATRYLGEFRPPVSDITVTVNGSFSPIVGSYYPGDWCCLIINDDFISLRLASNLEPRSDLLVRKIESYKVSVPDNPSFPEQVDLNLVTEWEVDKIGE